jgi:DNA-binding winged helix-turn-helix (wHTH) protein/tetratricopeptide (TPR) repeat protein
MQHARPSQAEDRLASNLRLGRTTLDLDSGEVVLAGELHRLTRLETELLRYLWARADQVVSREELLREVWRYRSGAMTRAVDHLVLRLRRKLGDDGAAHLCAVYGQGYVLARAEPAERLPAVEGSGAQAERAPFVGREAELSALRAGVASGPLVTVVGPPGAGKSRLVREHAGGAGWWVDCADVTEPDALAERVARALGVPVPSVGSWLAERTRALLVLDDADRAGAGEVIAGWLARARHLRVIVTARSRLGLGLERVLELSGLSEPDALSLLVERASRAGARLDPSDPSLPRLLALLDGLPLCIELAAARLQEMAPAALVRQLGAPSSPLMPALHNALASSWATLAPAERRALVQATVFVGPFDADAADGVLGPEAEDLAPQEVLASLQRRSLLRVDAEGRYVMYESVRAFARAQGEPDVIAEAQARHAEHFVALGLRLRRAGARGDAGALADGLYALPQLRAAWAFARQHDPHLAARAAVALAWLALAHGPHHDLEALLTEALEAQPPEPLRLALLRYRGELHLLDRSPALALADLAPAAQAADPQVRVEALSLLASAQVHLSRLDEAEALLEQALQACEEGGLAGALPTMLVRRGMLAARRGDFAGEARDLERAADLARAGGLPRSEGFACRMLAERAWRQGRLAEAQRWLERAVAGASDADLALLVGNLAMVALSRGQLEEGLALMRRHLRLYEELGDSPFLPMSNLGEACLFAGRLEEAEQLLRGALALAEQYGAPARVGDLLGRLGRSAQARGDLRLARELHDQALPLAVGPTVWLLAELRADLDWEEGALASAAQGYEAALAVLAQSGWALGAAGLRGRLACVLSLAGQPARAAAALDGMGSTAAPLCEPEARVVELARALLSGNPAALGALLQPRGLEPLPVRFLVERLRQLS